MAFDLATAKPYAGSGGGFDLSTAEPYGGEGEQPPEQLPEQQQYTFGEAVTTGAKNLPGGLVKLGGGMLEMAKHPVQTISALTKLSTGVVANAMEGIFGGIPDKPEDVKAAQDMVGLVVEDYKRRYGSWEATKRGIAEEPEKFLLDLSTVATGGGAVVPGAAGKTLSVVGTVTDPLALGKGAVKVVRMLPRPKTPLGAQNKLLLEAAEGRGPAIVNQLGQPGVSTVEAAGEAGATKFANLAQQAEKELSKSQKVTEKDKTKIVFSESQKITKVDGTFGDYK